MKNTLDVIEETRKEVERVRANEIPQWVYLSAPLTSTAWDGDAYSTTAKTLIDLSAVFGVPAGVKAVYVTIQLRDSGSAASDTFFILSPNDTANFGQASSPMPVNDRYGRYAFIVPCNVDGDVYYQVGASGPGTMDVYIQIWGWMY